MARHDGGKGIEFEIKIGMAGGDHFVVDEFFLCAQMAFEAEVCAVDDIAGVAHAERDGSFVRPIARGVRTEPGGSGTVARLAGDTFGNFKRPPALFGRGVEGVADEALGRICCFRAEFQDAGHAFADVTCEGLVGAAMLVLQNPRGIFVLQHAAARDRSDAAVATGGGAGTGANILYGLVGIVGRGSSRVGHQEQSDGEEREGRKLVVAEQHEVRQKSSFCL